VDPCILVQFIKKIQQDATVYQYFIIPYLYEAQHVLGDTPPIIRSLKLHWQPLVFHTWKVVWTCSWYTLSGIVCAWTFVGFSSPPLSLLMSFHVTIILRQGLFKETKALSVNFYLFRIWGQLRMTNWIVRGRTLWFPLLHQTFRSCRLVFPNFSSIDDALKYGSFFISQRTLACDNFTGQRGWWRGNFLSPPVRRFCNHTEGTRT
jgi:hypothetical protein